MRISTIELHKQYFNFAAGHFTLFSETDRENLHGHNYRLYCALTFQYDEQGLSFDYRHYKRKLKELCQHLDHITLIPALSPYLKIHENSDSCVVHFHNEQIHFLKRDYRLMPLYNITVEELSRWFLDRLLADKTELKHHHIVGITIKISSAPGQSASANWAQDN
jgi:6-pyruvoyltetrahydropterin/6-carboxytetrahydropterin synthase